MEEKLEKQTTSKTVSLNLEPNQKKNGILRSKRINPKDVEKDERLKELQMMRKEDMSLGQLFDFCRIWPEDLDGFIFEQKLNSTISEEFQRLQAKVDSSFGGVQVMRLKMTEIESKIEVCRAQMSRIGKFDGAIESFTRQNLLLKEEVAAINMRMLDNKAEASQKTDNVAKRVSKIEQDMHEISKIIDSPKDLTGPIQKQIEDMEDKWGAARLKEEIRLQEFILQITQKTDFLMHQQSEQSSKLQSFQQPLQTHDSECAKFNKQYTEVRKVILELDWHVNALKKNSLMTNLHLEAYLPFQIVSHAYDIASSICDEEKQQKQLLRTKFTEKIEDLEQNLLNCCNPEKFGYYKSKFSHLDYKLPDEYVNPYGHNHNDKNIQQTADNKKLLQKLEKMRRELTHNQSTFDVFQIVGIQDLFQLQLAMQKPIIGFEEDQGKIQQFEQQTAIQPKAKQAVLTAVEKRLLQQVEENSKLISCQLVEQQVQLNQAVRLQLEDCFRELDQRIRMFDDHQSNVDQERNLQQTELNFEIQKCQEICQKMSDRCVKVDQMLESQISAFQNTILQKVEQKTKAFETIASNMVQEVEEQCKKHVTLQMVQHYNNFKADSKKNSTQKSQSLNPDNSKRKVKFSENNQNSENGSNSDLSPQLPPKKIKKSKSEKEPKPASSSKQPKQQPLQSVQPSPVLIQIVHQPDEKYEHKQTEIISDPTIQNLGTEVSVHSQLSDESVEPLNDMNQVEVINDYQDEEEQMTEYHELKQDFTPVILQNQVVQVIEERTENSTQSVDTINQKSIEVTKQTKVSNQNQTHASASVSMQTDPISLATNTLVQQEMQFTKQQKPDDHVENNEKTQITAVTKEQPDIQASEAKIIQQSSNVVARQPSLNKQVTVQEEKSKSQIMQKLGQFFQNSVLKQIRKCSQKNLLTQSTIAQNLKNRIEENKDAPLELPNNAIGNLLSAIPNPTSPAFKDLIQQYREFKKSDRKPKNNKNQSDESVSQDDEEEAAPLDPSEYVSIHEMDEFKFKFMQLIQESFQQRDQAMYQFQKDSFFFLEEHSKHIEFNTSKLTALDKSIEKTIQDCSQMNKNSHIEFEDMFTTYKETVQKDIKIWRSRHNELESQYQRFALQFQNIMPILEALKHNSCQFDKILKRQCVLIEYFIDYQINLNRQDDLDKQSLSLIGMREKDQNEASALGSKITSLKPSLTQQPISIDPHCLNCETDQQIKVALLKKFKIACLSYKPTQVILDSGMAYTRPEMFDLQVQVLEQVKQNRFEMKELIKPRKVFDQLIQECFGERTQQSTDLQQISSVQTDGKLNTVYQSCSSMDQNPHVVKFTDMVSQSQQIEAQRRNKLRVGLRSQPTKNQTKRHNIVVMDHNNISPQNNLCQSQFSEQSQDAFQLPQLSARQSHQQHEFMFSFKEKQSQAKPVQDDDKFQNSLQASTQSRSNWVLEQNSLIQKSKSRKIISIAGKLKRENQVPGLQVKQMNLTMRDDQWRTLPIK